MTKKKNRLCSSQNFRWAIYGRPGPLVWQTGNKWHLGRTKVYKKLKILQIGHKKLSCTLSAYTKKMKRTLRTHYKKKRYMERLPNRCIKEIQSKWRDPVHSHEEICWNNTCTGRKKKNFSVFLGNWRNRRNSRKKEMLFTLYIWLILVTPLSKKQVLHCLVWKPFKWIISKGIPK